MVRYRIRFTGRVQHVGFRWKAERLAEALSLTGWVKNMWDGSVMVEIQGDEQQIVHMVDRLRNDDYIMIDNAEWEEIDPLERERSFSVKF
ncbi:MAG: acylphosphatase [Lachnospiraceae bacterium]|nr:acylphosphatase [Lachnospiraceae bacterium]